MSGSYEKAGVHIKEADRLVSWLKNKPFVRPQKGFEGLGGFSALFKVDFSSIKKPYLASSTDGVGTKLKLACQFQEYEGLGQDLVAMCLNDLVSSGANPLFFLDYFSTSILDLKQAKEFLSAVGRACKVCGCALIGGETAEMPGIYSQGIFDCAGFAVGVVDEDEILSSLKVKPQDVIIGVSSSGFHSNGYSLLIHVFEKDLEEYKKELLKPTYLYVELMKHLKPLGSSLKAAAHITGGGWDNLLRVLPQGLEAKLKSWRIPYPFKEVQKRIGLSDEEALRTFNCGVGLMLILDSESINFCKKQIEGLGFSYFELGEVVKGESEKKAPLWSFNAF